MCVVTKMVVVRGTVLLQDRDHNIYAGQKMMVDAVGHIAILAQ